MAIRLTGPRPLALALVAVLLLALLLAPARSAASASTARPSTADPGLLRGVNVEYRGAREIESELAAAKALHAQVIRVPVRWSAFEPEAAGRLASGQLSLLDKLVDTAAADHIKVIMVVDGTPCWDSSAPPEVQRSCSPTTESRANAWPPSEPSYYGSFMAFLAQRYGYDLAALEVWNEPDQANEDYLAGPSKALHYAAILKAAYPAIKRVAPQVPVLGGSFVGPNGVFLRLLYEDGIQGYYDGLAVHFYTLTIAALRDTHEVQLQHGDTKPLWLDEFGWSSCWPHQHVEQEQACVTQAVQAQNLVNMTRTLARMPYVAAEVFYKVRNLPNELFGVLTESGKRKPAFRQVASVFTNPFGAPSPVILRLRRRGGRLVASGSAPVGDFMELEALRAGKLRYRTIFTLDRFNRYALALPKTLGTRRLLVRVYQYGQGIAHAAVRRA